MDLDTVRAPRCKVARNKEGGAPLPISKARRLAMVVVFVGPSGRLPCELYREDVSPARHGAQARSQRV